MKKIIMLSFLAITAIAGVFSMSQKSIIPLSVENNVEALTAQENDGSIYYYSDLRGKPKKCTIFKVFDASLSIVYSGENEYSGDLGVGWTTAEISGLIETCPRNGDGCRAYSCHETEQ